MTPRLLLEPEAEAEFLEAGRWYTERNPAIAAAFRVSVERTLEAVERAPEQFPLALREIRKALVGRFPYVVYYVVWNRSVVPWRGTDIVHCPCASGRVARSLSAIR